MANEAMELLRTLVADVHEIRVLLENQHERRPTDASDSVTFRPTDDVPADVDPAAFLASYQSPYTRP